MNAEQIIIKKRDGRVLTEEEIRYLVEGYTMGDIPDYQIAAFLMAVYFQGMDLAETFTLTKTMIESGETIQFERLNKIPVDKHSTGGVGDKISLILAPLVAAAGLAVPMISGRGLGHTGGTLDKLEAIPGFRTNLTAKEFVAQVEAIGLAMIGQTEKIVPADRKIYALRDRTGTVASIPLVVASILSKKISEGIKALVLDVKTGKGAFFKNEKDAGNLARNLIAVCQKFNLPATALLTNMDQPLGLTVGNWLETREAIETLRGTGPKDVEQLSIALGAVMLRQANMVPDTNAGQQKLAEILASGAAFEKFLEMVKAQGGDVSFVEHPDRYPVDDNLITIKSKASGFVHEMDALKIGSLAMEAGAGRKKMTDSVCYTAGIYLRKKCGDFVERGEAVAQLFTSEKNSEQYWQDKFLNAVTLAPSPPEIPSLILAEINEKGQSSWPFSEWSNG